MPTVQNITVAGFKTALGIAKEATYGTAVAPTAYLPFKSENITAKNKLITNMAVRKSAGMPFPGIGMVDVGGTVDMIVDTGTIGILLGASLGTDAVTGAGPWTHTFKIASPLPSYTFSVDGGNASVHQYVGCKVDALDISVKAGDFLDIKANVIGQTAVVLASSSLSPTFSLNAPVEFAHLGTASGGTFTIDGINMNVADLSISLKNGLKAKPGSTGGRFVTGVDETTRQVTGSFTVYYDTTLADQVNLWLWGSATGPAPGQLAQHSLIATFTQNATSSLSFQCPAITISEGPISPTRNDVITQVVKFQASESTLGAQNDLTVVMVNETSTAYAP